MEAQKNTYPSSIIPSIVLILSIYVEYLLERYQYFSKFAPALRSIGERCIAAAAAACAQPLTRSVPQPRQLHVPWPSGARRRSHVVQLEAFGFFFFAAQRDSPKRQRVPGDARNVVELASDGQRGGTRSPDPKPTTADKMVPLPTSGGDGVMLRRAGQASPPVMEPIGNRKLSVGSNYDVPVQVRLKRPA